MTATPVLHIKRRFGIYVINSSKTIRRREAPGCLHACSQLNAEKLEAKVHPKLHARCCRPPPQTCLRIRYSISKPALSDSHPAARGGAGHLHASPGRHAHLWAHPFWFDASRMKGGGSYANPSPPCPWPRESKAAHPEVGSEKESQVFPLLAIQTSKGTFSFLCVFFKVLHTPTFSYK